jgi:hypothetical protein
MEAVVAFVARAWRDGIGPDDRAEARALASATPDAALFAAWLEIANGSRAELPPAPADPPARAVHAGARIARACLIADRAELDAAIDALDAALAAIDPEDVRVATARAFADLAIGDAAQWSGELAIARRRFEDVAEPLRPIALRIAAMLKLAGLALGRDSIDPALAWARKAMSLAEHDARSEHATRARVLLGMLHVVAGDMPAACALLASHESSALARVLFAAMQPTVDAIPLLADALREASERGDVATYALCILVGARRYATSGRDVDALVTLSAGILQLQERVPHLAQVLSDERATWENSWGVERFRRAAAAAIDLLDAPLRRDS